MHRPPTPFSRTNQPSPEAKKAGHEVAAEIRARIAAHKEAILQAQLDRALSAEHPQGHQAAKDLLDRIMPPESKISVAATNPDDMTDEELAAIAAGRGRTPVGPPGY